MNEKVPTLVDIFRLCRDRDRRDDDSDECEEAIQRAILRYALTLPEVKRLVEAAKLVDLCFARNQESDNTLGEKWMGDDEHEAWSAIRSALSALK